MIMTVSVTMSVATSTMAMAMCRTMTYLNEKLIFQKFWKVRIASIKKLQMAFLKFVSMGISIWDGIYSSKKKLFTTESVK